MKKQAIIFFCVVVLFAGIGVAARQSFQNHGLEQVTTLEQLQECEIGFEYVLNEDFEGDYEQAGEEMQQELDTSQYIMKVIPTGRIRCFPNEGFQEVSIEEIYDQSGSREYEENDTIWIARSTGMSWDEEQEKYILSETMNFMQTNHSYLVFCDTYEKEMDLDASVFEQTETKNQFLNLASGLFACLDLTNEQIDTDNVVTGEDATYRLGDLDNYEFFSTSKQVLEQMNVCKQYIINCYL